jgi:hypothetical protein
MLSCWDARFYVETISIGSIGRITQETWHGSGPIIGLHQLQRPQAMLEAFEQNLILILSHEHSARLGHVVASKRIHVYT